MQNRAFELGEQIDLKTVSYKLHSPLWSQSGLSAIDLSINNWHTIKYLNDAGTDFHPDITKVPNDSGGLYLFSIHCPVISGRTEFPAYIGRAQFTNGQNLRKRCKEYFSKFSKENERPKITKLFKYWASDIYLSFMVLGDNPQIIDFEKKLINSLLLPFNDAIPETEIRQAIKAFV
jgi:hypothetical protein